MTGAPVLVAQRRPRLGFLGVGWIGRHRMEGVAASGLAEIAAMADPSADALAGALNAAPAATKAASLDELLEMDLDAIMIATPSALHADQAIYALERGVAVFCQKPLARTAAETRRVVEAARRADRLLGVDFSYRHLRSTQRIRQSLREGVVGRVHAADLVFHNAYGPDKPWFYDPRQSGGGAVMDLGIHLIDLLQWCLERRRVVRVSSRLLSRGQPFVRGSAVEDYAVATLDLEDGAVVRLACSWNLPAGRPAVIEATFYGNAGAMAVRNVNGSFFDFEALHLRGTQTEVLDREGDGWGPRAAVAFTESLCQSSRYDSTIEEVLDVADTIDRIYAANQ